MGAGGSKMRPFDDFRASIEPLTNKIKHGQQLATSAMNDAGCSLLRDIFCSIRIMASRTSLVGNSKVMHHMLPNIVPPIDREYTLRFLYGNTTIATLGRGEVFGELAALDPEPRNASVTTIEPVLLLRMRHAELGELMSEHAEVAIKDAFAVARRQVDALAA
jgi:CRP-like cAMP-binding protein